MKSLLNSHSQTVVAKEKSALMSARLSWRPLRILRDLCGSSLSLFALILLAAFLFAPTPAHAYAGPGAGFAVLSSFWTLFVAFLYSAYAMFTWPFRHILRLLRRRKAYGNAMIKRAVILGFDGMDPELTERFIAEGRLPNLAKLREQGTFRKLRTTYPAISPVAWSTFMTGVNPGKHNIYDFLARDVNSYLPFLSSAGNQRTEAQLENRQVHNPARQSADQRHAEGNSVLALARKGGHLFFIHRVPVTFPPRKVFRSSSVRHVRA
jgi:hypothetical protein